MKFKYINSGDAIKYESRIRKHLATDITAPPIAVFIAEANGTEDQESDLRPFFDKSFNSNVEKSRRRRGLALYWNAKGVTPEIVECNDDFDIIVSKWNLPNDKTQKPVPITVIGAYRNHCDDKTTFVKSLKETINSNKSEHLVCMGDLNMIPEETEDIAYECDLNHESFDHVMNQHCNARKIDHVFKSSNSIVTETEPSIEAHSRGGIYGHQIYSVDCKNLLNPTDVPLTRRINKLNDLKFSKLVQKKSLELLHKVKKESYKASLNQVTLNILTMLSLCKEQATEEKTVKNDHDTFVFEKINEYTENLENGPKTQKSAEKGFFKACRKIMKSEIYINDNSDSLTSPEYAKFIDKKFDALIAPEIELPDVANGSLSLATTLSNDFIKSCIGEMSNSGCNDNYGLNMKDLKKVSASIIPLLRVVYEKIVQKSEWPSCLKICKAFGVFKNKGSRSEVKYYRPIVVSPWFSKVIQKMVLKQVTPWFSPYISESNHAYQPRKSTSTAVLDLALMLEKHGNDCEIIAVDYSSCFEGVSHLPLLYTVRMVSSQLASILTSMLTNQKLVFGDTTITTRKGKSVEQGGILSPFLFLIFDYMIEKSVRQAAEKAGLKLSMTGFSDDHLMVVPSGPGLAQLAVNIFFETAVKFGMKCEPSKTEWITTLKNCYDTNDALKMPDGKLIKRKSTFKWLGYLLEFSNKGLRINFKPQLARIRSFFKDLIAFGLTVKSVCKMYRIYAQSLLNYIFTVAIILASNLADFSRAEKKLQDKIFAKAKVNLKPTGQIMKNSLYKIYHFSKVNDKDNNVVMNRLKRFINTRKTAWKLLESQQSETR